MEIAQYLVAQVPDCTGAALLVDGSHRLDFGDTSRLAMTEEVLEAQRAAVIAAIKLKARDVILTVMPEWKQANMTARMLEKLWQGETSDAEWLAMKGAWDWVKAVRAHSDKLEAAAAGDPDSVDIAGGWPAWG